MLNKQLIAKTSPVANGENTVKFGDYRVSVLMPALFRIEKNEKRKFCDGATQSVWFRNFDKVDFKVIEKDGCIEIKTESATLIVSESIEKSYVILDGNKVPLDNKDNLMGTYRTLDCCDGKRKLENGEWKDVELGTGIVSKSGVAVFDDSTSFILSEGGNLESREDETDIYVFAFGKDYRGALKALYRICGPVPQIPRYALGNWWSRYHEYTEKEYLNILDDLADEDVPVTVATIDMDWHWSNKIDQQLKISESGKNDKYHGTLLENRMTGWTGYSWNKELFPDYKAFLKKIQERNLAITLNLHPADGVRYFEDMYEEMAKAMGIDPKSEKQIEFDMTDEKFINNYFDILHHPYEADGVKFWWIDWQQGTKSKVAGLDPLWLLNHYHYLDNRRNGGDALILSRYAGIGSHRYPVGFSGDTYCTWETLDFLPEFTQKATNVGYTWWSHDIGGHYGGYKDNELYARSVQFGVFSPINRLHCCNMAIINKSPDVYLNGCGLVATKYMQLRHRMIPFIYTMSHRNAEHGEAPIEPMYYAYPDEKEAYEYENQYMFGGALLVAPITEHTDKNGLASKKLWLPRGTWTDIFTNEEYKGGKVITVERTIENSPVFAKTGAIIPLDGRKNTNLCDIPDKLDVLVYNGTGEYELFEDKEGKKAFTRMKSRLSGKTQTFTFKTDDEGGVTPESREIKLEFINIKEGTVKVYADRKPLEFKYNDNTCVKVQFTAKAGTEYSITVTFEPKDRLQKAKDHVIYILQRAEGKNNWGERGDVWSKVWDAKEVKHIKEVIRKSKFPRSVKTWLLETL